MILYLRYLLTIFILILIFQSWTNADNIRELEIEGIVIGDSLLDHFSKQEIKSEMVSSVKYNYLNDPDKFTHVEFVQHSSLKIYDSIQIFVKNNPGKYEIFGIIGKLYFIKNINECAPKRDQIVNDLKLVLKKIEASDPIIKSHPADKSGESKVDQIAFWFNNDDLVIAECYDWSEKMGYYDNLKVNILTDEVNKWLIDVKK